MRTYTPEITLHAMYVCDECYVEQSVFPPTEHPTSCDVEGCGSGDFSLTGMLLYEQFEVKEEGKDPYFMGEPWMDSAGIPICNFCMNRDFEPEGDVLEEWLCHKPDSQAFTYISACSSCQEKLGLTKVTREELRSQTDGLFAEAEAIAEDHHNMLQAQIENDRLNYGEKYVLQEYYGVNFDDDEDYDEDEDF